MFVDLINSFSNFLSENVFGSFFSRILAMLELASGLETTTLNGQLELYFDYQSLAFTSLASYLIVYAVLYVFFGVGIYKISKNNGYSTAYLAFVPFARYYQMGKIIGEVRLFGAKTKNMGLFVAIACALTTVLTNVLDVTLYSNALFEAVKMNDYSVVANILAEKQTAFITILYYFNLVFNLIYIVLNVFMIIAFFRYYEKRRPLLFALLSIFLDLTPIFVFVVRNRKKYDFVAEQRRIFEQRYNEQNGGFNGSNGYSNGSYRQSDDNPYSDYSTQKDVFEEFPDDSKTESGTNQNADSDKSNGRSYNPYDSGKNDSEDLF